MTAKAFRRFSAGSLLLIILLIAAVWMTLYRDDIPYPELEARYASEHSRFLDLDDGVRLHVVDKGPAAAQRTLVLLHGFSASTHTWNVWIEGLSNDYRVVAIDLPMHGLTEAPEGWAPSIEAYASVLNEAVEALGLQKFVLVGWSMGGATAWNYALTEQNKLDGLVLMAASGWPQTEEEIASNAVHQEWVDNKQLRNLVTQLDMTRVFRNGLEASYGDPELVTEDILTLYTDLSRAPGHREGLLDMMLAPRPVATSEKLASIATPTLILHGDEDQLVPVRFGKLFEDALPNATLVLYEGVGHAIQETVPHRSMADLRAFLTDLPPPEIPETTDQTALSLTSENGTLLSLAPSP